VKVVFKRTGVDVYALKTAKSGKVLVYLDGSYKGTVDLYRSTTLYKVKIYDSPTISNGQHTLVLYAAGTRNASSGGYDIGLDRVTVG
jgi:hypothetical protein